METHREWMERPYLLMEESTPAGSQAAYVTLDMRFSFTIFSLYGSLSPVSTLFDPRLQRVQITHGTSMLKPVLVLKHFRPLYFHNGSLYFSRHNRLFKSIDNGVRLEYMGKLDRTPVELLKGCHSLLRRIFRTSIYRMLVTQNGNIIASFKGGVFVLPHSTKRGYCSFAVREGSRPVSLAYHPGGLAVWGEYFSNAERRAINIYGSADEGLTWRVVYTFPAGAIRHVHGISYDRWEDCFWISTGDVGQETAIFRASTDFKEIRAVLRGGQENRFYSIVVAQNSLLFANDSPNADNFIQLLNKRTGVSTNLAKIENSSFYSCSVGTKVFFSTNAEPQEGANPITSTQENDVMATHVWMFDSNRNKCEKVLSYQRDRWAQFGRPYLPKGLFQWSRIFFPEGENPTGKLFCYVIGGSGCDDCTLIYDVSDLG